MATLDELANKYHTDKRSQDHNYVRLYTDMLETRKNSIKKLLEVGFGEGGSVKMWQEYLPLASIYCIEYCDVEFQNQWHSPSLDVPNLNVTIGDSTKVETWENIPYDLDIIVDDGNHHPDFQIATFNNGFKHLKSGGLYFVEDLHCGLENRYTNGVDIFYPWIFDMIKKQQLPWQETNGNFYQLRGMMPEIVKDIYSYHFWKSVVCMERA